MMIYLFFLPMLVIPVFVLANMNIRLSLGHYLLALITTISAVPAGIAMLGLMGFYGAMVATEEFGAIWFIPALLGQWVIMGIFGFSTMMLEHLPRDHNTRGTGHEC